MYCTKCGADNAPGNAFCKSCGAKIDNEQTVHEQASAEQVPIYLNSDSFSQSKTVPVKNNKKLVIFLTCAFVILLILIIIIIVSLHNKPGLNKELKLSSFTPMSDGYLSRSELINIAGQELYIELSKSSIGDDMNIKKTTFSVQSIEEGYAKGYWNSIEVVVVKGTYSVYTKYGIMLDPCPFTVNIKGNGEVYSCDIDSDL